MNGRLLLAGLLLAMLGAAGIRAQGLRTVRIGNPVPLEVRNLYTDGLEWLAKNQGADGRWVRGQSGPGVDGICCLALLASGEDPNFGRYADNLRRAYRSILRSQDPKIGIYGAQDGRADNHDSMYHHGFATLAVAEAYGAISEALLWAGEDQGNVLSLGQSLERAVGGLITSQDQNPFHAWRYGAAAKENDTSVSGACLVALLAARNAGLEVPDVNIEQGLEYFKKATLSDGTTMYTLGMGSLGQDSMARSSIAGLVMALGRQKGSESHEAIMGYLGDNLETPISSGWPWYTQYYMAQALYQGDLEAWKKWNEFNTENIRETVLEDGSIQSDPYSTGMALLSMALNYRLLPIYER